MPDSFQILIVPLHFRCMLTSSSIMVPIKPEEDPMDPIIIESEFHGARDLFNELNARPIAGISYQLNKQVTSPTRLEPVITVALITAGIKVVSALVTAVIPLLISRTKSESR